MTILVRNRRVLVLVAIIVTVLLWWASAQNGNGASASASGPETANREEPADLFERRFRDAMTNRPASPRVAARSLNAAAEELENFSQWVAPFHQAAFLVCAGDLRNAANRLASRDAILENHHLLAIFVRTHQALAANYAGVERSSRHDGHSEAATIAQNSKNHHLRLALVWSKKVR